MSRGVDVELRPLTAQDRQALASFSCRDYRQPWSDVIQEMVREHLADELERNTVEALGLWAGGRLAGVVAWRIDAATSDRLICRSVVLAVQNGHVHRGYGRRLKQQLMERARQAGAAAVVSMVHWDNDAMIEINARLGASITRIEGDPDHCACVIPL